ncbi:hypothetical protein KR054_009965 [Drosophila jambulina]|nr:hypothetical protein KR054_009965 [Drosophila jambulina]
MHIMQTSDTLLLLIGLPIIPIGLVLVRILCWENIVLRLMHRGMEQQDFINYEIVPESNETSSGARIFCGALLLPTVSSVFGKILFDSMECTLQRTLFGGLTYVAVKGILKIYLRHKQYVSRKSRRIVDYTEDNKRTYMANNKSQAEGNRS